MAAFWAVFNNMLEIRADAFKLCKVYQRPPAKSVRNIGAWMVGGGRTRVGRGVEETGGISGRGVTMWSVQRLLVGFVIRW